MGFSSKVRERNRLVFLSSKLRASYSPGVGFHPTEHQPLSCSLPTLDNSCRRRTTLTSVGLSSIVIKDLINLS